MGEIMTCMCGAPLTTINSNESKGFVAARVGLFGHAIAFPHGKLTASRSVSARVCGVRALIVDSHGSSFDFIKRMEQAWSISKQPRPIICSSCDSKGNVECKWCAGTGLFILGDNMLCQVHSRNSSCVICSGKGSKCCSDCQGTGFRAKWLGEPPQSN